MSHFKKNEITSKEQIVYIYENIGQEALGNEIGKRMSELGYTMSEGSVANNAVYKKGNRFLRILLGAFHKYFKFQVLIQPHENNTIKMTLIRATTGMSGGMIGVNQVKKEIARLAEFLQLV